MEFGDGQKNFARRDCVRLIGRVARIHQDFCVPHVPKLISMLIRRLRDPDASVRDACAESLGQLVLYCTEDEPNAGDRSLSAFFKPLFSTLAEPNKNLQAAAGMAIAHVIYNGGSNIVRALPRVLNRLCKVIPAALSKANLYSALANLVEATGEEFLGYMNQILPILADGCKDSDWNTRRGVAQVMQTLVSRLGSELAPWREEILYLLETCKFDRVKPVRDMVQESLQLYRDIPLLPAEEPARQSKSKSPLREAKGPTTEPNTHAHPHAHSAGRVTSSGGGNRRRRSWGPKNDSFFQGTPEGTDSDVLVRVPHEGRVSTSPTPPLHWEHVPTDDANSHPPLDLSPGQEPELELESDMAAMSEAAVQEQLGRYRQWLPPKEPGGERGAERRGQGQQFVVKDLPGQSVTVAVALAQAESKHAAELEAVNSALKRMATMQGKLSNALTDFTADVKSQLVGMDRRLQALESVVDKAYARYGETQSPNGLGLPSAENKNKNNQPLVLPRTAALAGGQSGSAGPVSLAGGSWDRILHALEQEDVDQAFSLALQTKDDINLVRLMGRTGVVLEKLRPGTLQDLLNRFTSLLKSGHFAEHVIPWLNVVVLQRIRMETPLLDALLAVLHHLSSQSTSLGQDAAKLHQQLQEM
jgi:hypothetical protein